MSHELYTIDGEAQMFSVRETPWHGLGHVPQEYPGREKAIELAGHDFKVIERPLVVVGKERDPDDPTAPLTLDGKGYGVRKADGWKALIHGNSGDILNVTKQSYGVVQNDVLWDLVDALVEEDDVLYETAGVLRGGAVLWVLARAGTPSWIKGDNSATLPFIVAQTTHDGSGAASVGMTAVRVVCMNTKGAADAEMKKSGRSFTFKHTKNVMQRIGEAKKALALARREFQAYLDLADELAGTPVTVVQRDEFFERFIPMPVAKAGVALTDRQVNNVETARAAVRAILNGPTTADAHRLTAYGLWQAGIEYLDHVRRANGSDSFFTRTMLKQDEQKYNVAKLVREVIAA